MTPRPSTAAERPSVMPARMRGAQAVAGDAGQRRLLGVEAGGHPPQPAAFVAERQQFGRGVIAGIADAVARLPAADVRADRDDGAGGAVAGPEGELPVRQVGVLEPLMRAGVDGQFGAGTDGADLGLHQDLVGGRRRQLDLADLDAIRLDDDGLQCAHDAKRNSRNQKSAVVAV